MRLSSARPDAPNTLLRAGGDISSTTCALSIQQAWNPGRTASEHLGLCRSSLVAVPIDAAAAPAGLPGAVAGCARRQPQRRRRPSGRGRGSSRTAGRGATGSAPAAARRGCPARRSRCSCCGPAAVAAAAGGPAAGGPQPAQLPEVSTLLPTTDVMQLGTCSPLTAVEGTAKHQRFCAPPAMHSGSCICFVVRSLFR